MVCHVEFNRNVACNLSDVTWRIGVRKSWRDWEVLFRTIEVLIRKPTNVQISLSEWWYRRIVFTLEVFRDETQFVEAYAVSLAVTILWRLMPRLIYRIINYRQVFHYCSNVHGKAIANRFLLVLYISAYIVYCVTTLASLTGACVHHY